MVLAYSYTNLQLFSYFAAIPQLFRGYSAAIPQLFRGYSAAILQLLCSYSIAILELFIAIILLLWYHSNTILSYSDNTLWYSRSTYNQTTFNHFEIN